MTMTFKMALTNAKEKGINFKNALADLSKVTCAKVAKRASKKLDKIENKLMDSLVGTEAAAMEEGGEQDTLFEEGLELRV